MEIEKVEGQLKFIFPTENVEKYDDWSFYRNQYTNAFGGAKAVDFLYLEQKTYGLLRLKISALSQEKKKSHFGKRFLIKLGIHYQV